MASPSAPTPANGDPHRAPRGTAPTDQEIWFGENLRRLREQLGVSQSGLAREMAERGFQFHQTTISRIEAGDRPVRLAEATTLAEIVRTSVSMLIMQPVELRYSENLFRARSKLVKARMQATDAIIELWKMRAKLEEEIDFVDRSKRMSNATPQGKSALEDQLASSMAALLGETPESAVENAALQFGREHPKQGSVVANEIKGIKDLSRSHLMAMVEQLAHYAAELPSSGASSDEESDDRAESPKDVEAGDGES